MTPQSPNEKIEIPADRHDARSPSSFWSWVEDVWAPSAGTIALSSTGAQNFRTQIPGPSTAHGPFIMRAGGEDGMGVFLRQRKGAAAEECHGGLRLGSLGKDACYSKYNPTLDWDAYIDAGQRPSLDAWTVVEHRVVRSVRFTAEQCGRACTEYVRANGDTCDMFVQGGPGGASLFEGGYLDRQLTRLEFGRWPYYPADFRGTQTRPWSRLRCYLRVAQTQSSCILLGNEESLPATGQGCTRSVDALPFKRGDCDMQATQCFKAMAQYEEKGDLSDEAFDSLLQDHNYTVDSAGVIRSVLSPVHGSMRPEGSSKDAVRESWQYKRLGKAFGGGGYMYNFHEHVDTPQVLSTLRALGWVSRSTRQLYIDAWVASAPARSAAKLTLVIGTFLRLHCLHGGRD